MCIFATLKYMQEKPRAFAPEGKATLPPENFFILTPLKS